MLVIARLDRLARNVAFIANVMDSRAEFVACDMPQATRLTLHILAAVAEHERKAISQRTKVALAAAKARGTRLGSPDAARFAGAVLPIIDSLTAQGLGLRAIARELDRRGVRTARGGNGLRRRCARSCCAGRIMTGRKANCAAIFQDENAMAYPAIIAYNPINAD